MFYSEIHNKGITLRSGSRWRNNVQLFRRWWLLYVVHPRPLN